MKLASSGLVVGAALALAAGCGDDDQKPTDTTSEVADTTPEVDGTDDVRPGVSPVGTDTSPDGFGIARAWSGDGAEVRVRFEAHPAGASATRAGFIRAWSSGGDEVLLSFDPPLAEDEVLLSFDPPLAVEGEGGTTDDEVMVVFRDTELSDKDDGVAPDAAAGDGIGMRAFSVVPGTGLQYKDTIGKSGDSRGGTEEYPPTNRGYTVPVDGTRRLRVRDIFADRPDPSGTQAPRTIVTLEE